MNRGLRKKKNNAPLDESNYFSGFLVCFWKLCLLGLPAVWWETSHCNRRHLKNNIKACLCAAVCLLVGPQLACLPYKRITRITTHLLQLRLWCVVSRLAARQLGGAEVRLAKAGPYNLGTQIKSIFQHSSDPFPSLSFLFISYSNILHQ